MLEKYEMVFISPIGPIGVNSSNEHIIKIKFDLNLIEIRPKDLFLKKVRDQLDLYFKRKLTKFTVPYTLSGTNYQKRVLKEVANICFGDKKTYSDIAQKINTHPRPVGNACRENPIQLLIPCHRVIGKNNIGGFSGGDIRNNGNMILVKKNLLALER
jgi:methylated-DNA-[protein]-cysteine S-methyltransferase|tara:strand:+ start:106 stop:576 length:471 start_codon:yes stop_codon:yes gene_type:complete